MKSRFTRNWLPALSLLMFLGGCGGGGTPSSTPVPTDPWQGTVQFGTMSDDYGYAIRVDGSGNLYVTGQSYGDLPSGAGGEDPDAFLTKHAPGGSISWVVQEGTTEEDTANALALLPDGSPVIAGQTLGSLAGPSAGSSDAFLVLHAPDGSFRWRRQIGTDGIDSATAVVAGNGHIYVTGWTNGGLGNLPNQGGMDIFLAKYSESGDLLDLQLFGTAEDDWGKSIAMDGQGNVFLCGETAGNLPGPSAGTLDVVVRKYGPTGDLLASIQFGTAAGDVCRDIAVDRDGNVLLVGQTSGSLDNATAGTGGDLFVARYSGSLDVRLWLRQIDSGAEDSGYSIAAGGGGEVYVGGKTYGRIGADPNAGGADPVLLKFDPAGTLLWSRQEGTPVDDVAYGVSLDDAGNVYLAGYTLGNLDGNANLGGGDAFIRKYGPDGTLR